MTEVVPEFGIGTGLQFMNDFAARASSGIDSTVSESDLTSRDSDSISSTGNAVGGLVDDDVDLSLFSINQSKISRGCAGASVTIRNATPNHLAVFSHPNPATGGKTMTPLGGIGKGQKAYYCNGLGANQYIHVMSGTTTFALVNRGQSGSFKMVQTNRKHVSIIVTNNTQKFTRELSA